MSIKQAQRIVEALKDKRIVAVDAPYDGTVGITLILDDGTLVSINPSTEWNVGVLEIEIGGRVPS